ncbi:MAG: hypothetical protein ACP5JU_02605 [Minisyncoccia bacterium]
MVNNVDKTEDENRKKTKVAENPDLVKKILGSWGFTKIENNTKNMGKNASKNDIGFDFKVHAHKFRHTFGVRIIINHAPLSVLQ